jgi:hypothetical protein
MLHCRYAIVVIETRPPLAHMQQRRPFQIAWWCSAAQGINDAAEHTSGFSARYRSAEESCMARGQVPSSTGVTQACCRDGAMGSSASLLNASASIISNHGALPGTG